MGLQLLDHALDHGENYQLILSETAFLCRSNVQSNYEFTEMLLLA